MSLIYWHELSGSRDDETTADQTMGSTILSSSEWHKHKLEEDGARKQWMQTGALLLNSDVPSLRQCEICKGFIGPGYSDSELYFYPVYQQKMKLGTKRMSVDLGILPICGICRRWDDRRQERLKEEYHYFEQVIWQKDWVEIFAGSTITLVNEQIVDAQVIYQYFLLFLVGHLRYHLPLVFLLAIFGPIFQLPGYVRQGIVDPTAHYQPLPATGKREIATLALSPHRETERPQHVHALPSFPISNPVFAEKAAQLRQGRRALAASLHQPLERNSHG